MSEADSSTSAERPLLLSPSAKLLGKAKDQQEYKTPEELNILYPAPLDSWGRRYDEPVDPDREHASGWIVAKKPTKKCSLCQEICKELCYMCNKVACGTTICKQCSDVHHVGAYKGGRDQVKNGCWCSRSGLFDQRWRPAWYKQPPPRLRSSEEHTRMNEQTAKRQASKAANVSKNERDATKDDASLQAAQKRAEAIAGPSKSSKARPPTTREPRQGMDDTHSELENLGSTVTAQSSYQLLGRRRPPLSSFSELPVIVSDDEDEDEDKDEAYREDDGTGIFASLQAVSSEPRKGASTRKTRFTSPLQSSSTAPGSSRPTGSATPTSLSKPSLTYVAKSVLPSEHSSLPPSKTWPVYVPPPKPLVLKRLASHPTQLRNRRTVIIGGGLIGCLIARELALNITDQDHEIIIVEVLDNCMSLSSHLNGGIIDEDVREGLQLLAKYSIDEWDKLASDQKFRDDTCHANQLVKVTRPGNNTVGGVGHEHAPWWFRSQSHYSYASANKERRSMTVNPSDFAQWLIAQCDALKITIYSRHEIERVQSKEGEEAMRLVMTDQQSGKLSTIACENLVIAAGPWSHEVLSALFPEAKVDVNIPNYNVGWSLFQLTGGHRLEDTVLRVEHATDDPSMDVVTRSTGNMVWLCGPSRKCVHLTAPGREFADPRLAAEITKFAGEHLEFEKKGHIGDRKSGRGKFSRRESHLPIITKVPPSLLGLEEFKLNDSLPYGVFVCTGFGLDGLTLGFGAAKVVCRLIQGLQPEVNLSLFLPHLKKDGDADDNAARKLGKSKAGSAV